MCGWLMGFLVDTHPLGDESVDIDIVLRKLNRRFVGQWLNPHKLFQGLDDRALSGWGSHPFFLGTSVFEI